jgi:hypothetical protein
MKDDEKHFLNLLATQEFRILEKVEKAVKLVVEYGANKSLAARLCGAERFAVRRALIAVEEGREVGVIERPTLLTLKEEEQVVSVVTKNIEEKTPLKY